MVTVLLTFSRALHIGSGLMLVTVVAFRWLILLPAFSEGSGQEWTLFTPLFSRLNRIFVSAGIILVLSGMMLFWAAAAEMSGTSLEGSLDTGTLCTVAFQTQFGHVSLGRFALSILLGVIALHLVRTGWQARRRRSPLETFAALIAVALLISFGWTGHSAASGGMEFLWNITANSIHLLTASIWPAGLLPFAMLLADARPLEGSVPRVRVQRAVRRFSLTSLIAVMVLTATGLVNCFCLVGSMQALLRTPYGEVLCCKLVLFFMVLCIAFWNRYRILPMLSFPSCQSTEVGFRGILARLRIFVLAEFSLAVGVVVVVSILGTMSPAR